MDAITQALANFDIKAEELFPTPMLSWLEEAIKSLIHFCYVISAVEKAYGLAGLGGDILMYMGLAAETQQLLGVFEQNVATLEKTIARTMSECNTIIRFIYETNLINTEKASEETYKQWMQLNYHNFRSHIYTANKSLTDCKFAVSKIRSEMLKVQSRDYEDEVNNKIKNFKSLVAQLSGNSTTQIEEVEEVKDEKVVFEKKSLIKASPLSFLAIPQRESTPTSQIGGTDPLQDSVSAFVNEMKMK